MKHIVKSLIHERGRCTFATVYAWVIFAAATLSAQAVKDVSSPRQIEERLKAIYERGEFRPTDIRPVWLRDSSGIVIVEQSDPLKPAKSWLYDSYTGQRTEWLGDQQLTETPAPTVSPRGLHRVVAKRSQLTLIELESQTEQLLVENTSDRDIEYRQPVWSPDGTRILFLEADMTDVRQRSVLVPSDPSYPDVRQQRFARVGGAIEKLRVGVFSVDNQRVHWLPIPAPAEGIYLGQVEWAGNSDEVIVEVFSRYRNRRDFLLFQTTGDVKNIYHETSDTWVESSQGRNSGLIWIRDGQSFVVISEQDGWRHAYCCSRDGEQVTKLTRDDHDIIERAFVDESGGWFYYYASPEDATARYLYRVALDGTGASQRVTPEGQIGTHSYQPSPDSKWAVHTYSTLDTPPVQELIELQGHRRICELENNQRIQAQLDAIQARPTEFLKLQISEDVELDAWMIKPRDFDPSKTYPLFIYVYGEPHAQTVLNEWGAAQIDFHRVVADLGYVVVSIDNRGTPAPKGAAWRRSIFGSLGPLSTEEQAAALKVLTSQFPFVDAERVGIWGWSGGGSNTLNALFRKPDLYHVGIAVVPKPQPHLYNAWFQEIFMRTREENPEGYATAAAMNYADGLKGKLLIITGSGETNTHIQIIEGLVDRLVALGKPFDYMVYPNRDHGLREGDGTIVHVRMLIARYLMQNLPAGPRPASSR